MVSGYGKCHINLSYAGIFGLAVLFRLCKPIFNQTLCHLKQVLNLKNLYIYKFVGAICYTILPQNSNFICHNGNF